MTVFDLLGFVLLGVAAVAVLLRAFRIMDWSWPATLFPLVLFFVYQIVLAVVAGIGNWMAYVRGLGSKFLGQ